MLQATKTEAYFAREHLLFYCFQQIHEEPGTIVLTMTDKGRSHLFEYC